jgi:hypothetical protein
MIRDVQSGMLTVRTGCYSTAVANGITHGRYKLE